MYTFFFYRALDKVVYILKNVFFSYSFYIVWCVSIGGGASTEEMTETKWLAEPLSDTIHNANPPSFVLSMKITKKKNERKPSTNGTLLYQADANKMV